MSGALIVATIPLSLEEGRTIAVDAYEEVDRIDLLVNGEIVALTRYEAEMLAGYLHLACTRGAGSR